MVNKSVGIIPVPGSSRFKDVKPDDWFAGQVEAAAENGYVTGNPDGTFSPYRPITREQAAAMLIRVFGFAKLTAEAKQDAVLAPFTDADAISTWARTEMATAVSSGLLGGYTPTTLAPNRPSYQKRAGSSGKGPVLPNKEKRCLRNWEVMDLSPEPRPLP